MRTWQRLFIALLACALASAHIDAQWARLSGVLPSWESATTTGAIDAVGNSTVVISVSGAPAPMYLTTDGGAHFRAIKSLLKWWSSVTDVSIIDTLHLWTAMDNGQILASSDGGNTWKSQYDDTIATTFMDYIKMFDLKNGVAVGDGNLLGIDRPSVLRTTDGGAHWVNMNTSALPHMFSANTWRRIDFPTMSVGYFYTTVGTVDYPQRIYKTTDGGMSWNPVFFGRVDCLRFYNEQIGIAGYDFTTMNVYRTLDGGVTWDTVQVPNYPGWPAYANDYCFLPGDPSRIWHTDGYRLWFSSDAGRTWNQQQLDTSPVYGCAIVFTDATHGWFLANNGLLYHTSNGDHLTGIGRDSPELPIAFRLEQNYPNPFNPQTTISYQLTGNSRVNLKIYNMLGQEVASLVDDDRNAGYHQEVWDATRCSSGVYVYQLVATGENGAKQVARKRMMLLK